MFALRDKKLADDIISKITKAKMQLRFMHVCGTHQDTLVKHGLDVLLRKCGIEIGQGPGCPVCVTTPKEIEEILLLAKRGMMITTFGDMTRVPGVTSSLQQMKTEGCDVQIVYSIEDALSLAEKQKEKDVVFMAVGFETTAPTTASVILQDPPSNFSVLCCHRLIPPALHAILKMGEIKIDGFIEPGHVSTIIGINPYNFISKEYHVPQVIAGFEPLDLLMAAWMLVRQIKEGNIEVENEYTRAVNSQGNIKAQKILKQVFEPIDVKWRGFPKIPRSGLKLRKKYDIYDARIKYEDELCKLSKEEYPEPIGCLCGEVLRGLISSKQCPLFSRECTPETPVGPCMVSSEGSCHIEYLYSKK